MASSTAPAMLGMLFELFTTAFGTDVQVLYGDNARAAERQNLVLSGAVDYEDEEWTALGGRNRTETYKLDGFAQSRVPGATVQEAAEAAWSFAALVEVQLRPLIGASYHLVKTALDTAFPDGSAQVIGIAFQPRSGRPFAIEHEGVGYQIDFAVAVTARI